MMKYLVVITTAIISMLSLSFKLDAAKEGMNALNGNDSLGVIEEYSDIILNFIRRRHIDSKIRCFENNDANKRIAKLKLFAPVDLFFYNKSKLKKSGNYGNATHTLTLKVYKNSNAILTKDVLARYSLYSDVAFYPCYELNYYNLGSKNQQSDTCSMYIAKTLSDYRIIEVSAADGVMVNKHSAGMYGLLDEYSCKSNYNFRMRGSTHPEYEKSFFMVYSINFVKPHLLLGDDFCQSSNDWKVFYSLFQNDQRIQSDSALKLYAWAFYLRMYVREKFDAQYNPIIELDSLLVDTRKNTLTAIAKNIGYERAKKAVPNPRKDLLLTMDLNTGIIDYKVMKQ